MLTISLGLLQPSFFVLVDNISIYPLHGIGDGCDVKHDYRNHG